MKTVVMTLCIFIFSIGAVFAAEGVYIDRPDRNYSPSSSIWNPEPGDRVYFCIGCMVKIWEIKDKLWKIISFNGMTYPGQVATFNFDLCYNQKNIPDCMDIFILNPTKFNKDIITIRFFKFKLIKVEAHAIILEFIGFMDDEESEVSATPEEKTSPKKEDKGSDL